ncbi:MAG: hypothetical protein LBE38_03290 [Deltaproteobacteria bacterium]|jgi:AAA15 family ATPase/GTPase|nr:hypothetical protein [Deltaproteobacteria bacterium]
MLLKMTIENFLSFRDKTIFSMNANSGRKFTQRVQYHSHYKKRVLPIVGIFGGEPTGHESFCKALRFFRQLVKETPNYVNSLNLYTFQNYSESGNLPVKMGVEILSNDSVYRYSFMALKDIIVNERLVKITKSSKSILFERRKKKIKFHRNNETSDALKDLFKNMPKTQLFLPHSVRHKFKIYEDVYQWFDETLHVVGPGTYVHPPISSDETVRECLLIDDFIERMDRLNIGSHLDGVLVPKGEHIHTLLKEGKLNELGDFLIHVDKKNHQVGVYYRYKTFNEQKLVQIFPFERNGIGEYIQLPRPFSTEKEKHGFVTQLCLADIQASATPKLYVLNFLEHSFDLIQAREIIAEYLERCSQQTRSQIITTTGNALLLDKKVLRPDEIWISEPGNYGNTKLLSLGDFRKTIKEKPAWKGVKSKCIGGIYTTLLMAALEVNQG